MRVLIVDGDAEYAAITTEALRRDGHDVTTAAGARPASRVLGGPIDLVLLEAQLPDGSGLDLCRRIRARRPALPVIFVSARACIADVVAGLDGGADDYVAKPFHPSELNARVRAVARRAAGGSGTVRTALPGISAGGLHLDLVNRSVTLNGVNLPCSPLEFQILRVLAEHPGQVLSHRFLMEQVWRRRDADDATLLRARIGAIRRKIRVAGGDKDMVRTVHGVGYRLLSS
jgi:DNA-binding response OmpR family regulator